MNNKRTGLYWFTNDLRLHDQPALMRAVGSVDELVCVYVLEERWFSPSKFCAPSIGEHRYRFLLDSLAALNTQLERLGQRLLIMRGRLGPSLAQILQGANITDIFCSQHAGWYEKQSLVWLQDNYPQIRQHVIDSHTLFDNDQLPFELSQLPPTFTQFRKQLEAAQLPSLDHAVNGNLNGPLRRSSKPLSPVSFLPSMPASIGELDESTIWPDELMQTAKIGGSNRFVGGEQAGLKQLSDYFSGSHPACYKQVRNALDGWDNSSKMSPWLANGSISVRELVSKLDDYELHVTTNESTYWLYFELLWREFFQWYAHRYGAALYLLRGIKNQAPLTSFYSERYRKWVAGTTPYPIVNACMNELRETGYLSNRGRQIVASCFVNELGLDWRYGAAYFEQVLIDYDVASNWGNWQYLAGVGADAQPKRHFNLSKQTASFDPSGHYIERWRGDQGMSMLDSMDAADWPVGY
ncbi:DASH family cryptochrome [Arenicella xantha]|uniref:Cryptochrome DASH n=1 Tax=Arenicella xantha TaxID=644221 RepID=A0A395JLJ0_9GAMM|nr:DASH family cryptochrome [Arenicella xantha]RBP51666.1 deoxyribodipyrimidine photo-lyase (single-stranded DNA-specific) [Arenicella xantha]